MLSSIRSYFYNLKRFQAPLERFVFPVILLLYPLIGANQGLDISDTTYALANYEFLNVIDPMWALSTFGGNIAGAVIMKLPGAGSMLGMNIYCSLIISVIALVPYYILQRWMPGWMIFIGEFIAESLCWCPRVILYNYLTYLFFTLGAVFLLVGMFGLKRQFLCLGLAGVFLGMNVMVRFPNIVEAAFIVVLWFYCIITRESFAESLKKTLVCMLGYLIGMLVPFLIICAMYGAGAYFDMIGALFGMTEGASDYTTGGMLSSILSAYWTTISSMVIMLPCVGAGMAMFSMAKDRYISAKKLLYVAGLFVVVKFYFSRGVFTRNYQYYDCMFQAAMMFIVIAIILGIIGSCGFLNGSKEEQTLAFVSLLMILITPIGSNNYTFPVLNNLFIAAPVTLWLMRRLMQRLGESHVNFPWQAMVTMVIAVLIIQGAIFHFKFAFADGTEGQLRDEHSIIPKVSGMVTSGQNAGPLDELYTFMQKEELLDEKVLLFGGVPGLSYIFDMEPGIDTVWPDLDSYAVSKFDDQLMGIPNTGDDLPVIIVGSSMADYANLMDKYDILMDYIAYHDYNKVFESERYTVYANDPKREE